MPDLDVTELLTDPDLTDAFTVLQRSQAIGTDGVGTIAVTGSLTARGAVYPAGDSALRRLPEDQLMGKTLEVVTETRLRGPAPGVSPDLVVWPITNGDTYVVADLSDFTAYGAGFVRATLSSVTYVNQAPDHDATVSRTITVTSDRTITV